jgi:ribosomal protein S24E
VVKDVRNPLFKRREVQVRMFIDGATPTRKEVLSALASALGVQEDRIALKEVKQEYGERVVTVFANAYEDADTMKRVEQEHYFKRLEGKKAAENAQAGQGGA